jgi:hypothetical protein
MAFIAPLAGAAVGGGLLGSIVTTAVGIGINLGIAYFFPQKIKGPRADSLKAQTSKYGDQIARTYATIRVAGAVIWLKGDHVDEHVKKYRQGKALGPEVTEYSYTATFAVAFAWNGPFAAVPRIWADDKLIYDVSAESLQHAIDTGGSAIGVAKGATDHSLSGYGYTNPRSRHRGRSRRRQCACLAGMFLCRHQEPAAR